MKTKKILFVLSLAAVFGCDNADVIPGTGESIPIGLHLYGDLEFAGNASDVIIEADRSEWSIDYFDVPYISHTTHPSDIRLKENTAKSETFSYEWIEASKTDNMLRVSVTENTSDTIRSIRIGLAGDMKKNVRGQYVYVTQHPKEKE
jgi:hypothetical protein